jgi:hypothetical protein
MISKKPVFLAFLAIPACSLLLVSGVADSGPHSVQNANGTLATTGAPGEVHTCSQATCHGAGNGNSTVGGLADNTGPGNITITTSPAFIGGNQYVPNTVYHFSVTVNESGKFVYGFDAEILDNSGQTDLHIDNTIGSYTLTDPTRTRIGQAYGTGRKTITHQQNAGFTPNSSTFTFDWTAPASGIANVYTSAVAGNGDNLEDAQDNVYTNYILGLIPATTGVAGQASTEKVQLFPNPANDRFTLELNLPAEQKLSIRLYSAGGQLVKELLAETAQAGSFKRSFETTGLPGGVYCVKINAKDINQNRTLIIN